MFLNPRNYIPSNSPGTGKALATSAQSARGLNLLSEFSHSPFSVWGQGSLDSPGQMPWIGSIMESFHLHIAIATFHLFTKVLDRLLES